MTSTGVSSGSKSLGDFEVLRGLDDKRLENCWVGKSKEGNTILYEKTSILPMFICKHFSALRREVLNISSAETELKNKINSLASEQNIDIVEVQNSCKNLAKILLGSSKLKDAEMIKLRKSLAENINSALKGKIDAKKGGEESQIASAREALEKLSTELTRFTTLKPDKEITENLPTKVVSVIDAINKIQAKAISASSTATLFESKNEEPTPASVGQTEGSHPESIKVKTEVAPAKEETSPSSSVQLNLPSTETTEVPETLVSSPKVDTDIPLPPPPLGMENMPPPPSIDTSFPPLVDLSNLPPPPETGILSSEGSVVGPESTLQTAHNDVPPPPPPPPGLGNVPPPPPNKEKPKVSEAIKQEVKPAMPEISQDRSQMLRQIKSGTSLRSVTTPFERKLNEYTKLSPNKNMDQYFLKRDALEAYFEQFSNMDPEAFDKFCGDIFDRIIEYSKSVLQCAAPDMSAITQRRTRIGEDEEEIVGVTYPAWCSPSSISNAFKSLEKMESVEERKLLIEKLIVELPRFEGTTENLDSKRLLEAFDAAQAERIRLLSKQVSDLDKHKEKLSEIQKNVKQQLTEQSKELYTTINDVKGCLVLVNKVLSDKEGLPRNIISKYESYKQHLTAFEKILTDQMDLMNDKVKIFLKQAFSKAQIDKQEAENAAKACIAELITLKSELEAFYYKGKDHLVLNNDADMDSVTFTTKKGNIEFKVRGEINNNFENLASTLKSKCLSYLDTKIIDPLRKEISKQQKVFPLAAKYIEYIDGLKDIKFIDELNSIKSDLTLVNSGDSTSVLEFNNKMLNREFNQKIETRYETTKNTLEEILNTTENSIKDKLPKISKQLPTPISDSELLANIEFCKAQVTQEIVKYSLRNLDENKKSTLSLVGANLKENKRDDFQKAITEFTAQTENYFSVSKEIDVSKSTLSKVYGAKLEEFGNLKNALDKLKGVASEIGLNIENVKENCIKNEKIDTLKKYFSGENRTSQNIPVFLKETQASGILEYTNACKELQKVIQMLESYENLSKAASKQTGNKEGVDSASFAQQSLRSYFTHLIKNNLPVPSQSELSLITKNINDFESEKAKLRSASASIKEKIQSEGSTENSDKIYPVLQAIINAQEAILNRVTVDWSKVPLGIMAQLHLGSTVRINDMLKVLISKHPDLTDVQVTKLVNMVSDPTGKTPADIEKILGFFESSDSLKELEQQSNELIFDVSDDNQNEGTPENILRESRKYIEQAIGKSAFRKAKSAEGGSGLASAFDKAISSKAVSENAIDSGETGVDGDELIKLFSKETDAIQEEYNQAIKDIKDEDETNKRLADIKGKLVNAYSKLQVGLQNLIDEWESDIAKDRLDKLKKIMKNLGIK